MRRHARRLPWLFLCLTVCPLAAVAAPDRRKRRGSSCRSTRSTPTRPATTMDANDWNAEARVNANLIQRDCPDCDWGAVQTGAIGVGR